MRIVVISIFIIVTIISVGVSFHYNKNASSAQNELNVERFNRMVAEESLEQAKVKISSLEAELSKTQNKIKVVEKLVEQTKSANEDFKAQLQKVSNLNEALSQQVKELGQKVPEENLPMAEVAPAADPGLN